MPGIPPHPSDCCPHSARYSDFPGRIVHPVIAVPDSADSYLTMAYLHYKLAGNLLFETHSDVPADETYANIRAGLDSLQAQVKTRMESLTQGNLFLNVSPYEVSDIPLRQIKQSIQENLTHLKTLDASIIQMLKNGIAFILYNY